MQSRQQKFAEYSTTEVTTANRLRLLVMLYDGAIRFIDIARARIEEKNIPEKGKYIGKALAIVSELKNTLDFTVGGDLPRQLQQLYIFCENRLLNANLHNDASLLTEARDVMNTLRSAWVALEEQGVGNDPELSETTPRNPNGRNSYIKIDV